MYNIDWFNNNVKTEMEAAKLFQRFNIIPAFKICENEHNMVMKCDGNCLYWQCLKKQCKKKISIRKDNWLQGSRLPLRIILKFIYYWTEEVTLKFCEKELNIGKISVIDFNNYLREVCAHSLLINPLSIGGEKMNVEIDETFFSKRKYNRGRNYADQWIFGGVCRETLEVFLCAVPDRSENTLIDCIKKYIKPGSTILSDCWASYKNISNIQGYSFNHLTVNHSHNFVNPINGCHTQRIESVWSVLKYKNKKRKGTCRTVFDSYLCEFMWRQRNKGNNLFEAILNDISNFVLK